MRYSQVFLMVLLMNGPHSKRKAQASGLRFGQKKMVLPSKSGIYDPTGTGGGTKYIPENHPLYNIALIGELLRDSHTIRIQNLYKFEKKWNRITPKLLKLVEAAV